MLIKKVQKKAYYFLYNNKPYLKDIEAMNSLNKNENIATCKTQIPFLYFLNLLDNVCFKIIDSKCRQLRLECFIVV